MIVDKKGQWALRGLVILFIFQYKQQKKYAACKIFFILIQLLILDVLLVKAYFLRKKNDSIQKEL